jgi:2'-5' RNA ligase
MVCSPTAGRTRNDRAALMPKLAVVAYPVLNETAGLWIHVTRAAHDPQAHLIAAHVTLVFPTVADPEALADHIRSVVGELGPITLAMGEVRAVRDQLGAGGHVCLVPNTGSAELVGLHDRLYEGFLRDRLRHDIPYVPHVTIAAHTDFGRCLHLARELDVERPIARGRIEAIDLIEVGADAVRTLASFSLDGTVTLTRPV